MHLVLVNRASLKAISIQTSRKSQQYLSFLGKKIIAIFIHSHLEFCHKCKICTLLYESFHKKISLCPWLQTYLHLSIFNSIFQVLLKHISILTFLNQFFWNFGLGYKIIFVCLCNKLSLGDAYPLFKCFKTSRT